jgi:hypothetical protein
MALISCGECKKEISDKAVACPHCGAPRETIERAASIQKLAVKKKSSNGLGTLLLIILGIIFFMAMVGGTSNSKNSSKEKPREAVVNSAWDGSVYQAEKYLKDRLKDPDSYESISWGEVSKNEQGNYVTWVKYRAKNSFGGYNVGQQAFTLSPSGEVLTMSNIGE